MTTNDQVYHALTRISERHPQLRVMQLISNCIPPDVLDRLNHDLYYVENEELLRYLLEYEQYTLEPGEI